jgi:hypothetical protein
VVFDGTAGSGRAKWADEIDPPNVLPGLEAPRTRPGYTLDTAPVDQTLRPLEVFVSERAALAMVTEDLGMTEPTWLGRPPRVHPFFLAARMAPLTRHNFTYGPTIHVRSQVQHVARPLSGQRITIGARIVETYERNGHWYQVLDGVISGGDGHELARLRHHTIFRPRGT